MLGKGGIDILLIFFSPSNQISEKYITFFLFLMYSNRRIVKSCYFILFFFFFLASKRYIKVRNNYYSVLNHNKNSLMTKKFFVHQFHKWASKTVKFIKQIQVNYSLQSLKQHLTKGKVPKHTSCLLELNNVPLLELNNVP